MKGSKWRLTILIICLLNLTLFSTSFVAFASSNSNNLHLAKITKKMKSGQKVKIICYGDSTTWGDDGTGNKVETPYPETLQVNLRKFYLNNNITVVNSGHNGQQSSKALANFDKEIVPQKPDLVIIMYGINDISGRIKPTNSVDVFKKDIVGMVEKSIKNKFDVMLMTPTYTQFDNKAKSNIIAYGQESVKIAKKYDIPYVDVQKELSNLFVIKTYDPKKIMVDEAHYKKEGYQLIANIVAQHGFGINKNK